MRSKRSNDAPQEDIMPSNRSSFWRSLNDHFEPDDAVDPKTQRQLRGHLEQIDYAAYAANRTVMSATLRKLDIQQFEKLGVAVAQARARWIATALAISDSNPAPSTAQIDELNRLRSAYEELTLAYEATRRLVERGYLAYGAS